MMKLTNKDYQRIFSNYIGQFCFIYKEPPICKLIGITNNECIFQNHYTPKLSFNKPFNDCQLLLRPLSSITDEQILELCKLSSKYEFGDYRFSKWKITPDPANGKYWNAKIIKNDKSPFWFQIDLLNGTLYLYDNDNENKKESVLNQTYWQWYFINGFAIPLYPYNKNAMELELAIDSTTILNPTINL